MAKLRKLFSTGSLQMATFNAIVFGLGILLQVYSTKAVEPIYPITASCYAPCFQEDHCNVQYDDNGLIGMVPVRSLGSVVLWDRFGDYLKNQPTINWKMTLHPVLANQKPLFGWTYIRVNKSDVNDEGAYTMALHGATEDNIGTGVGDFVHPKGISASCEVKVPSSNGSYPLGKTNILPCHFVKTPMQLVGSGFGMSVFNRKPQINEMTFLHRIDLPACPLFGDSIDSKALHYLYDCIYV